MFIYEFIANLFVLSISMAIIAVSSFIIYIIAGEYFEHYGLTERQRLLFGIMTVVVIILLMWR